MISFKQTEEGRRGKFDILEDDIWAGEITYQWAGSSTLIIDHTETDKNFSGKGFAKKLVYRMIDFAKENNAKIIPLCPFAKKVMEADPTLHEYMKSGF